MFIQTMLATPLKAFALAAGIVASWCRPDPPPVKAAPVCTPLLGPDTDDAAIVFVCESCRGAYFTDSGLPDGVSFADCVANGMSHVRQ